MPLQGKIFGGFKGVLTKPIDRGIASHDIVPSSTVDWEIADGSGEYQAQLLFADTRQLAASASENLDLAGSLVDVLGRTLTFTAIKAIRVEAAAGNTNNVLVGGAASNAVPLFGDATDVVAVKPGGVLQLTAPETGFPVTAGTGDILKIANSSSGSAVDYTITLIGIGTAA